MIGIQATALAPGDSVFSYPLMYVGMALVLVGTLLFVGGLREWPILIPGPSRMDLQREAFKDLLADLLADVVPLLDKGRVPLDTPQDAGWINRVQRIVTAAVGNAEARLIVDKGGEGLQSEWEHDPWRKLDFQRQRLVSLSERADSLKVRHDFDPRDWKDRL